MMLDSLLPITATPRFSESSGAEPQPSAPQASSSNFKLVRRNSEEKWKAGLIYKVDVRLAT